ncbi:hypothetical protein EB232_23860 [Mesorhizobium sp. NZP2077]|nr:hypothetical protein EB232_23860 [Mesorhizobium sp. NZP2077]
MVMGGNLCPWSGDFESPHIASFAADTPVDRGKKTESNKVMPGQARTGAFQSPVRPAVIGEITLRNEKPKGERYGIQAVGSATIKEIRTMASKQGKKDNRLSDKEAMHIAETTDVSPGQAKELAEKHGKDKARKEAANFKAEG